jgi:hypothetical protein
MVTLSLHKQQEFDLGRSTYSTIYIRSYSTLNAITRSHVQLGTAVAPIDSESARRSVYSHFTIEK